MTATAGRRRRSLVRGTAVAVAIALVAACSGGGGGGSDRGAGGSAAEIGYGLPPLTDGSVTYQPDVVLVGGGARMVRSMSPDGLTLTIDKRASRLSDVKLGDVMYLASRVVGRVVAIEDAEGGKAVTLGPAQLTEIFRDAHFEFDAPINLESAARLNVPDVPGGYELIGPSVPDDAPGATTTTPPTTASSSTETSMGAVDLPPVSLITQRDTSSADVKQGAEASSKVTIGDFSVEPYLKKSSVGLKLGYKKNGMTLVLDFGLKGSPSVAGRIDVTEGKLTGASLRIDGITGMTVNVEGGTTSGQKANVGVRVEAPFDFPFPLQVFGVPMTLILKQKFIVETAFSAKNSTLTGSGEYSLSGPMGFDYDGTTMVPITPSFNVVKSFLQSLEGVSVGINAIVFATQTKILFGVGTPAVAVGPFASLTAGITGTVGSDLGIVKCKQSSIDILGGFGVGASLSNAPLTLLDKLVRKRLERIPGNSKLKLKFEPELALKTVNIVKRVGVMPKIKACGA